MKKLLTLGLAFALVMVLSAGAMAMIVVECDEEGPMFGGPTFETGEGWYENYEEAQNLLPVTAEFTDIGEQYVTVEGVRVFWDEDDDIPVGDQEINVTIDTAAVIPCYIEMELIGNGGWTLGRSFGAEGKVDIDRTEDNNTMLFHPEFGGIMNADWSLADEEISYEACTEGDFYINACDMWTANLFANIDYNFDVIATDLVDETGDHTLTMDMRAAHDESLTNPEEFLGIGTAEVLSDVPAMTESTVYMQFRVPFNEKTVAGEYEGDITFSMYSI